MGHACNPGFVRLPRLRAQQSRRGLCDLGGFAFDLVPDNGRLADFKRFCRTWLKGRAFDQMISEDEDAAGTPRWVHIGYKNRQGGQRRQLLTMRAGKYIPMTA